MDLVDSVAKVVKVAIQIKELVEKAHQNKEECKKIATRVERLRAIVECLDNTDVSSEQTMVDALNELEETFRRALKLVRACQTRNVIWLFLTAGNVSKQLREVKDEIMEHMHIANFSNCVQQTVMFTKGYIKDPAAKPKKLLKVQSIQGEQEIQVVGSRLVWQDTYDAAGEVDDAHASYPTNGPRSEVQGEKESFPAGSLEDTISRSSRQLDWSSAFRIIRGIAQGVAHIHTKGAVHLDLKPANVLLDSDMNPKICDFERSKILNQEDEEVAEERVTQELAGTLGYLPPEYIADGIFSFKHDVFSFGILLLHTISKSGLLQDSTDWIQNALEGRDDVDGLLGPSPRDEAELKEIKRCMDIGLQCAAKEQVDRPTMWDVVDMLDGKEQQPRTTPVRNRAYAFKKKGRA